MDFTTKIGIFNIINNKYKNQESKSLIKESSLSENDNLWTIDNTRIIHCKSFICAFDDELENIYCPKCNQNLPEHIMVLFKLSLGYGLFLDWSKKWKAYKKIYPYDN